MFVRGQEKRMFFCYHDGIKVKSCFVILFWFHTLQDFAQPLR